MRHSRYFLAFTLYTLHSTPPASYPLIRNLRGIITSVDDATAGKICLFDKVNHALVVFMRIDANILAFRGAPVKYKMKIKFYSAKVQKSFDIRKRKVMICLRKIKTC